MKDPEKKKLSKKSIKNSVRLYPFIKPYRWSLLMGIVFLLLTSLTAVVFPFFFGNMIDAAKSDFTADVNKVGLSLMVLFILQAIFSYFRIYLFSSAIEKGVAELRKQLYTQIIKFPLSVFNKRRVGELNSRLSTDVTLIQETYNTTLPEFIRQTIIIVGGIISLFTLSVKLTFFMLTIVPMVALIAVFFGKFIKKFSKQTQDKLAESNVIIEESLQGISMVKSFTNESYEIKRYDKILQEVVGLNLKSARWRGAFASFIIFCVFGAIIAVVWYGSYLVQTTNEITIGQLTSFIIATALIGASVGGIATLYTQFLKALGATETMFELFDEETESIKNEDVETSKSTGEITFNNVSFSYPNRIDVEVLYHINVSIQAGEKIAVVGPSGGGKSTIANLIMKFYKPTDGEILLDQKSLNAWDLTDLRRQIAIVPQETLLFGGTIRENILYGKPNATEKEMIEAARIANALEFIDHLPEQFNTIVGERGIQLSGGQRQRIAIARAVIKNPSILILDEATSSLDSESERLVQDALEKIMQNRTSIIIAHRLSTIKNADRILVIEKGVIKEIGKHEDLIAQNQSLYKKLVDLQALEIYS